MNLNNFAEHISPKIIERGYDYFVSECVDGLEKVAPGMWLAEVHGSEIYTVEVNTNRSAIKSWDCDCPYDFGPICKHVVAVIYAIAEQMESGKKQKPKSKGKRAAKDKVQEIGEKVSKEDLWQFVLTLFKSDRSIKNRLIAHFAELLDEDLSLKYKTIVRNYYKAAQGRHGFIDYRSAPQLIKPLYELAEKASGLLTGGDKTESLAICKSLIEEVPVMIHHMDDSDGGAGDVIYFSFDTFAKIAETAPPMMKDDLFEYVLQEFPKQKYHDFGFEDHFLSLFPPLISSAEQENKFMELIDGQIEEERTKPYSSSYVVTRLTKTKVDYILQQGREKEALAIIEKHQELPDFREMLVNRAIFQGDFNQAKSLCRKGIRIAEKERFPGHVQLWQRKLYDIAKEEGDMSEQQRLARQLFFDNHYSMEWYSELKSLWSKEEWAAQSEGLINQIKGKNQRGWHGEAEALARIFVEEGYRDQLLKLLQRNSKRIDFVGRYAGELMKKYPAEVLDLYEDGVKESIKQTGRKVYRRVVSDLRIMKKIKGGDERAHALIKHFLNEYNNRPAMMDEFQKAFPSWIAPEGKQKKQEGDSKENDNLSLF